MIYIGIDPGKSGGMAAIDEAGEVLSFSKMPEGLLLLKVKIGELSRIQAGEPRRVALEFVRSSPQMGVSSSFTFGRGLGHLEAMLVGFGLVHEDVHPVKWQNALGCRTRGDKNISKAKAEELFPGIKITHAIADALLLAEYLRQRAHGVRLTTPANVRASHHGEESKGQQDAIRREAQGAARLEEKDGAEAVEERGREAPPIRPGSAPTARRTAAARRHR